MRGVAPRLHGQEAPAREISLCPTGAIQSGGEGRWIIDRADLHWNWRFNQRSMWRLKRKSKGGVRKVEMVWVYGG
jgi:hypothetical protein